MASPPLRKKLAVDRGTGTILDRDQMTKSFKKILILSCAAIGVPAFLATTKTCHRVSRRAPFTSSESNVFVRGEGGGKISREPGMLSTKASRVRPSAEEVAKKRLKSRRIEIVRHLQMMRDGGLNDQHPAMRARMEEIEKDPNVRIGLVHDRTYVLWTRVPTENGSVLTQYHFEVSGGISFKSVHRVDLQGSPQGSRIFNETDREILKVSYGYRKSDGRLVEERIFDSQEKRVDDEGKEEPVRRVVHSFDVGGSLTSEILDLMPASLPPNLDLVFSNPFPK